MITIGLLLLVAAFVMFILAGFNFTANGKCQFQWLAFACLVLAAMVGSVPLQG